MRLCVAVPCFFKNDDFCSAIRKIGEMGFDAAETYNWKELDLDAVRAVCDETGVELISICTSCFELTSPEYREKYLTQLRESCEAAKKLGVKQLITQGGKNTGAPRKDQHRSMVETLRACVPILEEYGVTLMLEPLNTYVNHPDSYLWSSVEAFDVVKEVASEHVRVIFDIYHQQIMEGNILPNILNNLEYVAHIHVAGTDGRHEPWLGENNFEYIFDAIDKAGYTGVCGLEYGPTLPPEESLRLAKERYQK